MRDISVPDQYEIELEPWFEEGSFSEAFAQMTEDDLDFASPSGQRHLVNFLVKYFCALQKPEYCSDSMDLIDVSCELAQFKHLVDHPDVPNEPLYAEGMLFDFCRTAGLCQEVLESPFESGSIIDAGTGTAVLLLVAEIASIRKGIRNRFLGFDLNQQVLGKVEKVLSRVGSDLTLLPEDTTTVQTWERTHFPPLALVINENLPHPRSSLSKEPYLEVLLTMKAAGYDLGQPEHVPDSVFANAGSEFMICPSQPEEARDYIGSLSDPSSVKAPNIFINGYVQDLRLVGSQYRQYFPTPELWTQRWH